MLQAPGLFAGVLAGSGIYDVLRLGELGGAALLLHRQAQRAVKDDACKIQNSSELLSSLPL